MKTVATFRHPHEAYLFQSLLEGNGIQSFITDDNTIQTDWLLSNAIGGVKVTVADEDLARATEIHREYHGPQEAEAKEQNKRKHTFARYLKFGAAAFLATLAYLLITQQPTTLYQLGTPLTAALIIGAITTLFTGLLDL